VDPTGQGPRRVAHAAGPRRYTTSYRRIGGRKTCRSRRVMSSGYMPAVCSNRFGATTFRSRQSASQHPQVPDRVDGDLVTPTSPPERTTDAVEISRVRSLREPQAISRRAQGRHRPCLAPAGCCEALWRDRNVVAPNPIRADRRHVSGKLITRRDLHVFLPPIGGTTLYYLGDPAAMRDPARTLTCRIHDECNGSDVSARTSVMPSLSHPRRSRNAFDGPGGGRRTDRV